MSLSYARGKAKLPVLIADDKSVFVFINVLNLGCFKIGNYMSYKIVEATLIVTIKEDIGF